MKDNLNNNIEDLEVGKCDWFTSFMKTVIKDLNKNKTTFVFSEEQVNYVKEIYGDVRVHKNDGIYYIYPLTNELEDKTKGKIR